MKKRSIALLLAIAMLFTLVLSACGDDGSSSSASTPSSSAAEDTTDSSTAGGEESSEAGETSSAATSGGKLVAEGLTTEVGTPREQTLVVECQSSTDVAGQFNTYMTGTPTGFGIHQLMSTHMWEMNTAAGHQFGEAVESATSNEDFTEWEIKVRQGIKWSDGEDFNAEDVAFTFNMIKENENIGASSYTNMYIDKVEATDDYTVKFTMTEPFPRLDQCFGNTVWGCDWRIVPEHIYSTVGDVTQYKDEAPVVAGPYTVDSYDPLGTWILYKLRDDWQQSTLGVVGPIEYGFTADQVPAQYVWFRYLGDSTTKQMAMTSNEVDILCEMTLEELQAMQGMNDKIGAWMNEFPYANPDDPGAKGIIFNCGIGAPYDNPDFRWGIALALDIDALSENIFSGAGRAAPIPLLNNTNVMQELYTIPMQEWLENFELDLGDGTKFKPYDTGYADRMAQKLGLDLSDEDKITTFGAGWWKHDEEAATKLLEKAGLTKGSDGKWQYDGKPFTFEMSYIADTEAQVGRGVQAAFNQLQAFGFDCTITSKSSSTWDVDGSNGNFQIAGYWPSGGNYLKDIYRPFTGFDNSLIKPVGENASGGYSGRWNNQRVTDILHEMANLSPEKDEEKCYELATEMLQEFVKDMPVINFLSGTKFVPTNSSYWEGYPNAEDPYNGPWWWWSCFKYMLPKITPVAE